MPTADILTTNDFSITKIKLNPKSGQSIDLRYQMMELNIHEDIYNSTTYGTMVINDAKNQLKYLPIFGFETVDIEFNTPNKDSYKETFRVYKITDRALAKEREQLYVLHFTSKEMFTNTESRVSKSYKGYLLSDIASDIQENFLDSSFEGTLETTKFLHHIVVPFWYPMKAINWLAARANSAGFAGSNYLYFQNKNGYNFVSVENLMSQKEVIEYIFQPANVLKPYTGDSQTKTEDLALDNVAVESYNFLDHTNVLENITNGMYGNELTTHNFVRKIIRGYDFTYGDTWNKYTHVENNIRNNPVTGNTAKSFLSSQDSQDDAAESVLRVYTTEVGVPQQQYPNHVEDWMNIRVSQIQQLKNIRANITVPGDSERTVGEMVTFTLPSAEPLQNNNIQMDIYYRGRYLVTGLRHVIIQDKYTTILEITKDAVFSCYP